MRFKKAFKTMAVAAVATSALSISVQANAQDTAAAPSSAPTTQPAQETPSAAVIMANLENISPINYVYIIDEFWKSGNKLQASFWFYIWQIRTAPWVEHEPELATIRGQLNEMLGSTINLWIAADPALMRSVAHQAAAYEARMPYWTRRPDGISEQDWQTITTNARTQYLAGLEEAFKEIPPEQVIATRQQNNLPVGTPTDQGAPLPPEWL